MTFMPYLEIVSPYFKGNKKKTDDMDVAPVDTEEKKTWSDGAS